MPLTILVCAALSLLFCLMLPARSPIEWLGAFLLAFAALLGVWLLLKRLERRPAPPERKASRALWMVIFALPCLAVWGAFLAAYWPGVTTYDSFLQWFQIHGVNPWSDWHPVTHTMVEFLLTRIVDAPYIIAIAQVLGMALVWGWILSFFYTRGFSKWALLAFSALFALLPYNGIYAVTLWKDVAFAILMLWLVYLVGQVWLTGGAWLDRARHWILLGVVLAFVFLFRHNGLVALVLVPPALFLFYRSRWRPVLYAALVATALVLVIRQGIGFGLLKAQPNSDTTLLVLPVQQIAAVVHEGGERDLTYEEQKVLIHIAPLAKWKSAYNRFDSDRVAKPWGDMGNFRLDFAIAVRRKNIVEIYLHLLPLYPWVMARSEIDLMTIVWSMTAPPGFMENNMSFFLTSQIPNDVHLNPGEFRQPNQGAPLKNALDAWLTWTQQPGLPFNLFWMGGGALFASLALSALLALVKGKQALLLFVPTFANALSLFVSMPLQNFRYVYPYVIALYVLALFALAKPAANASQ